jgi:hypothetical protein
MSRLRRSIRQQTTDSRQRTGHLLLSAVCCLLSGFLAAAASAEQFGPVEVTALPSLNGGGISGYAERRFEISNPTSESHEVQLFIKAPGYGVRVEMHVNRKFVSPARSTIEVAVAEPVLGWAPPREVTVTVDGRRSRDILKLPGAGSGRPSTQVLFSRSFIDSKLRTELQKRGYTPTAYEYTRTDVPPEQWSTNWLAYTSYSAIGITPGDWNEIPAAAQAAVLRWVRAGGLLLVTGGSITPPDTQLLQTTNRFTTSGHGFGTIINVPGSLDDAPETLFNGFIIACDRYNALTRAEESPMSVMPLLGPSKMPVGLLFTALLTFAIVGGPLSLFWLARRDRRLWIFWTLPGFATITSLALIGTSLVGEGWQRVHRSASITYLDENIAEATTLGLSGIYCTLPPDGDIRFSAETEIRPYDRTERVQELDASDGQRLLSGWVDSRVSTYFALRRSEHRRERLSLTQEGAVIRAVNGFGSRMVQLWVADANGTIYQSGLTEPGAHATLKPAGLQPATPTVDLFPGPPENWPTLSERLRNDPRSMLRPGMYIAVLQTSPFLESPLEHPSTQTAPGVVVGVAKWSTRDAL